MIRKKRDKPKYDDEKTTEDNDNFNDTSESESETGKKRKARKKHYRRITQTSKAKKRKRYSAQSRKRSTDGGSMSALSAARGARMLHLEQDTHTAPTRFIRVGGATGRSRAKQAYPDPRQRGSRSGTTTNSTNTTNAGHHTAYSNDVSNVSIDKTTRGRGRKKLHSKATRQPRTAGNTDGSRNDRSNFTCGWCGFRFSLPKNS